MKESARIFRFAVIGTLNALIMAVTVWVMMDELDINYMLSNVTAYILAQIHKLHLVQVLDIPYRKKEQHLATSAALFYSFRNGLRSAIPFPHRAGGGTGLQRIPCPVPGLFIYGSVNFLMNKRVTFR